MTERASDLRKGVCPKCGAQDVRCHRKSNLPDDKLSVTWLRGARIDRYVCVSCGYLESYVEASDLRKIADKWERVQTPTL
jgi:predicted RNA-binding Zn-ribbon protein involved in translation (DUF1610 family)